MSDDVISKPLQNDVWIYRMVVAALGLAVLFSIIGAVYLVSESKETPETLIALGSAAIGAISGLLAKSPSQTHQI